MLDEICGELRNYFVKEIRTGTFTIEDGVISPSDFIKENQFFRIVGSVFNDGVYQHPHAVLTDETFDGAVWVMAIPPALIALSEEIKKFNQSEEGKPTAYTSESFGGYTYSKATDVNGSPLTWQKVFSKQLNRWRKI